MKEKLKHPKPSIKALYKLFEDPEGDGLRIETPYPERLRLPKVYDNPEKDDVSHPEHYTKGIEVTDFISSWNMDWFRGNILKYIVRCPYKGNTIKDLEKAKWYIDDLIDRLKKGESINACY